MIYYFLRKLNLTNALNETHSGSNRNEFHVLSLSVHIQIHIRYGKISKQFHISKDSVTAIIPSLHSLHRITRNFKTKLFRKCGPSTVFGASLKLLKQTDVILECQLRIMKLYHCQFMKNRIRYIWDRL